tara:strand:- start:201 stop:2579 length:2379 start_codon:yes stop_codon:yes gene_type:complete
LVIKKAYVIGAGLTGLVTSYELKKKGFDVEIIEQSNQVGGLAKSIKINNKDVDLGPHIYHSPDQDIIDYWKKEFPKLMHQRDHWAKNFKNGKFYDYPISREFINSLGKETANKINNEIKNVDKKKLKEARNYYDYTLNLAGPTLQEMFFTVYPEKVWGVSTKKLDANWAPKRVEIREKSRPFYTNQFAAVGINGSGTIIRALEKKAKSHGVRFKLNESINKLIIDKNQNAKEIFTSKRRIQIYSNDLLINTTSITNISKQLNVKTTLKFRGIKLIYLFLKNKNIFPKKTDFVYFDDPDLVFNRISDQNSFIKNPMKGQTIFCCEVTYSKNDTIDRMSNRNLEKKVINDFYKLPFVPKGSVMKSFSISLPEVYPMFFQGYQKELARIKGEIDKIRNMYIVGSLAEFAYSDLQVLFGKGIDLAEFLSSSTLRINKITKTMPSMKFKNTFALGKKTIGDNMPSYLIAEIGLNHNGDLTLAKKLIDEAIDAGADAVKFQSYKAENRVSKSGKTSRYVEKVLGIEETDYEMLKKYQLSFNQMKNLFQYARRKKIEVFSAPFDLVSVDELEKLNVNFYKLASFDLINLPLVEKVAKTMKPIILSTGMANLSEIEEALGIISTCGNDKVALLHCTSTYPCPPDNMNIKAIDTLKDAFKLPVGLSDHVIEDTISLAAVARGANIIEKHFTLDKSLEGPDHILSLEPQEFKDMVLKIKNIEVSLGSGIKSPSSSEFRTMVRFKKSLYTSKKIKKGQIINEDMLSLKGPAYGILPKFMDVVLGHKAKKDLPSDHPLTWEDIT